MQHKKYSLDLKPPNKYTHSVSMQIPNYNKSKQQSMVYNDKNKIGATRISQSSLFLQPPLSAYNSPKTRREAYSTRKSNTYERKLSLFEKNQQKQQQFYLPLIRNHSKNNQNNNTFAYSNPQQKSLSKLAVSSIVSSPQPSHNLSIQQQPLYYQSVIYQSLKSPNSSNYLITLAGGHFLQSIQALKVGKQVKITNPQKEIKLNKKNPKLKTVYLDLDQTLIHCDQSATSYTVKLNFPIQGSQQKISAGIRIRPHCKQFLQQLSKIAQIIIFTASSQSYADVILEYIDPQNKYFSHRLYRHHCKLQKGYYTKDLRLINRRLEDSLLVDNSAHCFMMQPYNGVPVIPFYHYLKDKELINLLKWLKQALKEDDVRNAVKKSFFWHKYFQNDNDPKKIFITHYQSNFA